MGLSEYTRFVLTCFIEVEEAINEKKSLLLDGHTLRLSDAVAVSRYLPIPLNAMKNRQIK